MSPRTHLLLRVAALAVIGAAWLMPRGGDAVGQTSGAKEAPTLSSHPASHRAPGVATLVAVPAPPSILAQN